MKTIVVIACLIALVSVAECFNYQQVAQKAKRDDVGVCNVGECTATGGACRVNPSAACEACQANAMACLTDGTTDPCVCGDNFMNCVLKNATDDKLFCNPTLMYQTCKVYAPTCACLNYTQVVPIPTCNEDAFCNNKTNTCQLKTGAGQYCNDQNDCEMSFSSLSYDCEDNKCVLIPGSTPIGDACDVDDDCFGSQFDEVTCRNGVCFGQNQGGNCTSSASCNYGLYCDAGNCAPWLVAGDDCELDNDNCGYPTVCGAGSVCVKAFTKARGSACEQDAECVIGSACVNDLCAAPPAAKACDDDSDCPTSQGYNGYCQCDPFTGKNSCGIESSIAISCADETVALYDCITKFNCTSASLSNECIDANCQNEAQCAYLCIIEASGAHASCYPSLTCGGTTGTTGGSTTGDAVAMQVSMAVIAVAVAALTL